MAIGRWRRLPLPFPVRITLLRPLLFPLWMHPLLFLFLCTPALPVLLYFCIDLSLIIWSLSGLLWTERPIGCKGARRKGIGTGSTSIDCAQYSQAQKDHYHSPHHRWYSLCGVRVSDTWKRLHSLE